MSKMSILHVMVQSGDPGHDRRCSMSRVGSVKLATGHGSVDHWAAHGKYASRNPDSHLECSRIGTTREAEYCGKRADNSHVGVAILVGNEFKNVIIGYNAVNERIIFVRMYAAPCVLNIIQVYAPTNDAKDEEVDKFYACLETLIGRISNREVVLILGDLNVKVGDTIDDVHLSRVVGRYDMGTRNEKGERLIQFCVYNNCSITKTLSEADCGSDHQLLVCSFRTKLKANKKTTDKPKLQHTKCRKEKREHINRICSKIEQHANPSHSKDAFKKIKLIIDKFKLWSWAIHNTNNKIIDKLLEVWRKYCEKLYSEENIENTIVSDLDEKLNILLQEVQTTIKKLAQNKSPGIDLITDEMLKSMGDGGVQGIHKICNLIWKIKEWPKKWTTSVVIPLHKKGATTYCDNYRFIALQTHISKVMLHII
ncbi:hypothetical protein ACFW04_014145 [Cataglyphis niger]